MTTESRPRFKITYATLRNDNEELHARLRGRPRGGEARARRAPPELHRRPRARGPGRDDRRLADRPGPDPRPLREGLAERRPGGRRRRPRVPSRRGPRPRGATAWRSSARRPSSSASARCATPALMAIEVGKNRLEALGEVEEAADLLRYYAQTMEDNGGYDHPMDNLGDGAVHTRSVLRPSRRLRGHQPVQLPDGPRRRPDGRALIAGNTVVFKPSSAAPMSGVKLYRGVPRRGHPRWRRQPRHGPRRDRRRGAAREPGHRRHRVHRLVRRRHGSVPDVLVEASRSRRSSRWAARTRRSSRARPTSRRRPRASAQRLRLRRPEVLRELPRLRREAGPRRAREAPRREDRGDHDRRPAACARTGWARSSTSARSTATSRRSPRRGATAASSSAASG